MNIKNQFFWVTGFIGLMLDQLTKYWVVQSITLNQSIPLWVGVFHLTYVTNRGAAFGLFSEGGGWLRWLSLLVSLGLMALALLGPNMNRWEQAGYGFILGGAFGNGIDRFLTGEVVDFIDLPWIRFPVFSLIHSPGFNLARFPVFNLADVFINVGLVCLLIATFLKPSPPTIDAKRPR
jgi:signal peptidase II